MQPFVNGQCFKSGILGPWHPVSSISLVLSLCFLAIFFNVSLYHYQQDTFARLKSFCHHCPEINLCSWPSYSVCNEHDLLVLWQSFFDISLYHCQDTFDTLKSFCHHCPEKSISWPSYSICNEHDLLVLWQSFFDISLFVCQDTFDRLTKSFCHHCPERIFVLVLLTAFAMSMMTCWCCDNHFLTSRCIDCQDTFDRLISFCHHTVLKTIFVLVLLTGFAMSMTCWCCGNFFDISLKVCQDTFDRLKSFCRHCPEKNLRSCSSYSICNKHYLLVLWRFFWHLVESLSRHIWQVNLFLPSHCTEKNLRSCSSHSICNEHDLLVQIVSPYLRFPYSMCHKQWNREPCASWCVWRQLLMSSEKEALVTASCSFFLPFHLRPVVPLSIEMKLWPVIPPIYWV